MTIDLPESQYTHKLISKTLLSHDNKINFFEIQTRITAKH